MPTLVFEHGQGNSCSSLRLIQQKCSTSKLIKYYLNFFILIKGHTTTRDTPIEAVRYLLGLPSMEARHKVEQGKAYLNAMQIPKNPSHDAVKEEKGCRLARGKS